MVADTGKGRLFLDPAKQHDDLRLLRMAIKKRWEIPEEYRSVIVGRLRDLIETGDDEIALKAISEVRQLESQNQKDEHKLVDVSINTRNIELDAIAREIGVDLSIVVDAEKSREGSTGRIEVDGTGGADEP